jgi:hypothetical protein
MVNEMLALAQRPVIEGRRIVARQRQRVSDCEASGRLGTEARRTLDVFERTLAIFEDHLRNLERDDSP